MTIKETLLVSDYLIKKTIKSKIDIGKCYDEYVGIACPKCKTTIREFFSDSYTCVECGLHMETRGNALICTLE